LNAEAAVICSRLTHVKKALPFLSISYVIYAVLVLWYIGRLLYRVWLAHAAGQMAAGDAQWIPLATVTAVCIAFIIIFVALAALLSRRRRRQTALVLAAMSCLAFPMGTLLGAVTLFALTRPQIRAEFEPPA